MNVFTHVTVKSLKKNRMRTAVTVIGIVLATAMLTAVTTFISSLQSFMVRSAIAEAGNWYGAAFQIPKDKREELAGDPEVTAFTSFQEIGYARLEAEGDSSKPYLFVAGVEDTFYDLLPIHLMRGRLPEDSTELVIPRHMLVQRRLTADIGDTITLELGERVSDSGKLSFANPVVLITEDGETEEELVYEETRTYTIVGVIERPDLEDYNAAGYFCMTGADPDPADDSTFTCYYRIRKSSDIYSFQETRTAGYGGVYNTNLLRYLGASNNRPMMRMIYGLAAILILLIMTGGVSLVYNSFAISVSDRTRQFGLLASTGATPKQIRRMVITEALIVGGIGIPLGILSGIGGIGVTLHFLENSFAYMYAGNVPMYLSVSVPAVVIAGATALLTVLLSAFLPAGRAARVSPMEAIRQSRDIRVPRQVQKKGRLFFRLFGLEGMIAGKHFSRNRRQYRATIFSLFISIVLFISASSFSAYLKNSIGGMGEAVGYDVSVYFEGADVKPEEEERFVESIRRVEGVERMISVKGANGELAVLPEQMTEKYRTYAEEDAARWDQEFWQEDGTAGLGTFVAVLEDADFAAYLEELGLSGQISVDPAEGGVLVLNQIRVYDPGEERYRFLDVLDPETIGSELKMSVTDYKSMARNQEEAPEEDLETENYQQEVSFTVTAFVEKGPMNLFARQGDLFGLIMSQSVFEARIPQGERYLNGHNVYVQASDHQGVRERIENLSLEAQGSTYLFVYDETESMITEQNMLFTVEVFTYGFIVLISLIAVANVFNTISTGFLLRRREFAILTSVGMAPKGMNRMLSCECILYGCKALLYGLPVSVFVTWRIYKVVQDSIETGFFIPAASIVIAVFSVFAVVFATMIYARNKMKKENVIDNIRQESL